jgi:hypothetical protein
MNPRVIAVKANDDYSLILTFDNQDVRIYQVKPLLNFGVFKELQNLHYFKQVKVVNGTVQWANEQDICPDTLYLESKSISEYLASIREAREDYREGRVYSYEEVFG